MNFDKLCKVFTMQEPFYGVILSSIDRVPVSEDVCPTMGVGPNGKTFKLIYNPKFVESLSDDAVLQVLKHEMLHLCLHHLFMDKELGIPDSRLGLMNVAQDVEVNQYIDKDKLGKIKGCFAENWDLPKEKGCKFYYDALLKKYCRITCGAYGFDLLENCEIECTPEQAEKLAAKGIQYTEV